MRGVIAGRQFVFTSTDNGEVKPTRPSLVQSWKQGTGGTSGLHRAA